LHTEGAFDVNPSVGASALALDQGQLGVDSRALGVEHGN